MIGGMTTSDPGTRWALTLAELPDAYLTGTRLDVLAWSERLTEIGVAHSVHRRPSAHSPWQLLAPARGGAR